ncbi:MAG: sulfotransferase [Planctomycetota bacterium]|nr:sulfotransferase [Planctomycetota bacterium]
MSTEQPHPDQAADLNKYPWYRARFWDGMRTRTFWSLLRRHRFAVSCSRLYLPLLTIFVTPFHSLCHRWQELRWRRRVEAAPPMQSPLFIIGHWRSGTTLLHELLALDQRHTYPTNYDCFSPANFLSTRWFNTRCFKFLVPDRRPMDNVSLGWDRPQEDEFGLLNLGIPSIYETAAFPNQGPVNEAYLDFVDLPPADLDRWKAGLLWFLRRLHFRDPRRFILKSPPHLGRVATLLKMFPDAKFVHIVRDPFAVFASSLRLWRSLFATQAMQVPNHCDWLEDFVLDTFDRLYDAYHSQRELLKPDQIAEVRYEELVTDPIGRLRTIYENLELSGFEELRPLVEEYVAEHSDYQPNRHHLDETTRAKVADRWDWYLREYGYPEPSQTADAEPIPAPSQQRPGP